IGGHRPDGSANETAPREIPYAAVRNSPDHPAQPVGVGAGPSGAAPFPPAGTDRRVNPARTARQADRRGAEVERPDGADVPGADFRAHGNGRPGGIGPKGFSDRKSPGQTRDNTSSRSMTAEVTTVDLIRKRETSSQPG